MSTKTSRKSITKNTPTVASALTVDQVEKKLRSHLRRIANRRNSGSVTADDVHSFIEKNELNLSYGIRQSLTNRVLRGPDFFPYKWVRSQRPVAKGREILEWMINN